MNRFAPSLSALACACLLVLVGCSGVTDSPGPKETSQPTEAAHRFDPTAARTPTPSKSLTLADDWQPPAPTRTAPAQVKARVQPKRQWGAPFKPVSANATDAEFRAVTRFAEPLRPAPGTSSAEETAALAAGVRDHSGDDRGIAGLERFLATYPDSRWAPAVHLNLGTVSYEHGYFEDALAHWTAAWERAKAGEDPVSRRLANLGLAESAKMNARVGRQSELEALLDEAQKRNLTDEARRKIESASEGAWMMRHRPGVSFQCGPFALLNVAAAKDLDVTKRRTAFLEKAQSPSTGFSIPEVHRMSGQLGLDLQIAKREVGAPVITPAVVHWKLGHFAAIVQPVNGAFLVKDPTFTNDTVMTANAFDHEASGYFLVPAGPLPKGWSRATAEETAELRGKGLTSVIPPPLADAHQVGGECQEDRGSLAMARYRFQTLSASLYIIDTPITYKPAFGPDIRVDVTYSQRELGKFKTSWNRYIRPGYTRYQQVSCGPGCVDEVPFPEPGVYPENEKRGAILATLPGDAFKYSFPDGRQDYYEHVISNSSESNLVPKSAYLSRVVDPQGHEATVEYDTTFPTRIQRIVDATGLPTEFHYDHPDDSTLLTSIEDPYGRTATFAYVLAAEALRLQSIQDPYGIVSSFEYNSAGEVSAITTPYGTTRFNLSIPYVHTGENLMRYVEATDPMGQSERVEFNISASTGIPGALEAPQPNYSIVSYSSNWNNYRNTFYWDKLATKLAPGDYKKARIYHWLHLDDNQVDSNLESEVPPLESRIFYNYPGQQFPNRTPPSVALPSAVGRVVKDAAGNNQTQATKFAYNAQFNVTSVTDPALRQTSIEYAANGIDVTAVKQLVAGTWTPLFSATYGNGAPPHRPVTTTDGAGKTTTFFYSATTGQVATITNAKSEVVTFGYGTSAASPDFQRLISISGDVPGGNRSFTYDDFGRVRTSTTTDGQSLIYDYDSLDRLRTVTYPDGSFEQFEYEDHSLVATRDREGRWTRHMYNPLRQRVVTQDPTLRTTQFQWCRCGELKKFVDGNGNVTEWERDVAGRVTKKKYPNGTFEEYGYDLSGRLSTVLDAMSKTVTYKYGVDDRLAKKDYADPATPDVVYTHDLYFPRVETRTDGSGVTSFYYHPYGTSTNGAGQLAKLDGPLANDTQKYSYDELGRLKKLEIVDDATGTLASFTEEYSFDARGRVTTVANDLGGTTYTFAGQSPRPATVSLPNGMATLFDYFGATTDFALKQIKHLSSGVGPSVLSQFDYTYRPDRAIDTWKVDQGAGATTWSFGYDGARQLTKADRRDANQGLLESLSYAYDKAGNRTQVGTGTTAPKNYDVNPLNQLLSC